MDAPPPPPPAEPEYHPEEIVEYAEPAKSNLATAALITGILSIVSCGVASVVAIVIGHMSKGRIKRSADKSESGKATIGLVLGYVGLGLLALTLTMSTIAIHQMANERKGMVDKAKTMKTMAAIAELNNALMLYKLENKRFPPTLETLVDERIMNKIKTDGWGEPMMYDPENGRVWSTTPNGHIIDSFDL